MNHKLKILTLYSILAVLMTLKTLFSSRLFSSFCWDSMNKDNVFLKASILSCRKINISVVFYWNRASSHYICSVLCHGSINSFYDSLVDLLGLSLSSDLGLSSRYSLTTIVLKSVGLLRSYTLYVSFLRLINLNRPVYLLLWLVLPSYYTRTSKLSRRLWITLIDRLFR